MYIFFFEKPVAHGTYFNRKKKKKCFENKVLQYKQCEFSAFVPSKVYTFLFLRESSFT